MQIDSTQNIARRYRHVFTLPSTAIAVLYSSIPIIAMLALSSFVFDEGIVSSILYILLGEILLLAAVELDTMVLKHGSKFASFRRIAAITIVSNALWFIVSLVGFVTSSEVKFLSLAVLGAFFAIAFRAIIFGAAFYGRPSSGIPLAFLQPAIVIVPILLEGGTKIGFSLPAIVAGTIAIIVVSVYIFAINNSGAERKFRPLSLLQAFLNAWVVEDASTIEDLLEFVSKEEVVRSDILKLNTAGGGSVEIIVPGVHPGPFYPIGSSNLPADIFNIRHSKELLPLTVHSISDHDLNLCSKKQVQYYVSTFLHGKAIDSGSTMTPPVVRKKNKATVEGFALGLTAILIITQAPFGMEDFPTSTRDVLLKLSGDTGFDEMLIVDSHNSEGPKPSPEEAKDAEEASAEVLAELKRTKQCRFRIGYAHSSEVNFVNERDIGPAGVGLVVFELENGTKFSLAIVDANNSVIGFREKILERFEGPSLLELCTSDTHITAAKILGQKGYIALGERISSEKFAELLNSMSNIAVDRLSEGCYESTMLNSSVKTIGSQILNDFSSLLDRSTKIAKVGALLLGVLGIALIVLVALV